jgi:tRNA (guanosine-2'-O-)-methyltransferase
VSGKQLRKKKQIKDFLKENRQLLSDRMIVAILQDWEDPYNVGGLFRTADAAGIVKVILTGKTPSPTESPAIAVTSMGAHRSVKFQHEPRYDDAIAAVKAEGYEVVAVEVSEGSQPFHLAPISPKVAFVLGNEKTGIYPNVLKQCDRAVFIPMCGKGRSLNVQTAAAIVILHAALLST